MLYYIFLEKKKNVNKQNGVGSSVEKILYIRDMLEFAKTRWPWSLHLNTLLPQTSDNPFQKGARLALKISLVIFYINDLHDNIGTTGFNNLFLNI